MVEIQFLESEEGKSAGLAYRLEKSQGRQSSDTDPGGCGAEGRGKMMTSSKPVTYLAFPSITGTYHRHESYTFINVNDSCKT